MMKKLFRLINDDVRRRACEFLMNAPEDTEVRFSEPKKSRIQEERAHAMIDDISKQCKHLNQVFDAETWKRLVVDQFKRETLNDPDIGEYWRSNKLSMIPSLDGCAMVVLGEQTRKFPKKVYSHFIEFLFALGSEMGVQWSDVSTPAPYRSPPALSTSRDIQA
jgi:hypothetical protein